MASESGLYSVELFAEALTGAAEQAQGAPGNDAEAIRSHLEALLETMETSAAIFYPSSDEPLTRIDRAGRPIQAPDQISASTQSFIRNLPIQVITSQDAIFNMGHLRSMPLSNASSSLWAAVGVAGTIALFDHSVREFNKSEQQMVRLFAAQLASVLATNRLERITAAASPAHAPESTSTIALLARDLINPLTAMLGYIDLLKSERLDERGRHYLQKLQEQTEKTHHVVMAMSADPAGHGHSPAVPHPVTALGSLKPGVPAQPYEPIRTVNIPPARVLIIQKNEATLAFKKAVLSPLTTDVVATFTGSDAIALLQSEDVNAVILDDEMDGDWPGRKLYAWICEHKPELRDRVLITIGSRPRPEIQELIDEAHLPHVSKPLQMVELFAGIQQILGAKPNRMLH
jgi:CheY-like chemotaxis protein